MRINHNISALNTYRQLAFNNTQAAKSMEKLSSGLRINRAGDDAAGLAISEKMRGQIRGLEQAQRNAQDGISLLQTAEGALNETHAILQRMRELAVQSANDTNTPDDRNEIQKEINQLINEIDRIGNQTEFNTKKLLNGGAGIQGKTNDANVSILGGSAAVKGASTLTLDSVKAAGVGTITFTEYGDDSIIEGAAAGTFSINGVSISMDGTESATDFINKINAVSSSTGVIASGDFATGITFTTIKTGSSAKIDISGFNNVVSVTGTLQHSVNGGGATNSTGTVSATGTDASAVIDAEKTTGSVPTSITASGNILTIHGGDYDGLQLRIDSAIGTTGTNDVQINITANNVLTMHIGANDGQTMNISINDMRAQNLGVNNLDVTTQTGAENAIQALDTAIQLVSAERSKLGAYQNRLEHTINNLGTSAENLTAAESRIRDVDYALAA
ncbi:hypothetical protein B1691_12100 [Geobacillus sp. 47C-IIb]|uniref:flagellin N-terminal helical domain-containing protein n=1 Tax=Geobacillus sp. 47C-IIb TaxID=1963026 RepID=UPI0009BEEEF8|nr:flagellin [Geobacillus sp. 47C-IIb]OQP09134.1 hypothetical protein B1691_12100 [Geobacillus sp. 47C-IIb]QNU32570.1 flagellin [Geobacillus sp. 47C-IIb]